MYIHAGLTEKARQQGDQGNADEGNTTTGHKLFYALGLCPRIILPISFQKVDATPNTERTTEGYNESLQSFDCRIEEFHILPFPTHFVSLFDLVSIDGKIYGIRDLHGWGESDVYE